MGSVLDGSYRITRLIGQGGMGAVYEGVQVRLERRVAIKLMARELSANPEAIARFRREAEVTSQLGHPHIVQVFDFGAAPGGEPYLVMEYLEGEDLEKRLQRVGRLPLAAASHIVRQVASALSATHAKGIVHRDLKPANVFLLSVEGETDFVKVVDFGISKVRSATTKLTAALAVMGTPNYMAPEQAAGRIAEIDGRTDQWALACIAYELLAGRPPFVGEDIASLLYQVIHQAPSPISQMSPGLPIAVEGVLHRALSKTQAERFATLTEFSRAFEGAASGKAVAATLTAPAPAAAAPAGAAAIARAPTMPSSPGIAPVTTFSSATGQAGEPEGRRPVRIEPPLGLRRPGRRRGARRGRVRDDVASRRRPRAGRGHRDDVRAGACDQRPGRGPTATGAARARSARWRRGRGGGSDAAGARAGTSEEVASIVARRRGRRRAISRRIGSRRRRGRGCARSRVAARAAGCARSGVAAATAGRAAACLAAAAAAGRARLAPAAGGLAAAAAAAAAGEAKTGLFPEGVQVAFATGRTR